MDQSETKTNTNTNTNTELVEVLNKLKENEEIDVIVYVKKPVTDFDKFLQVKKEKGELKFNFLEFANCYVVEASKHLLLEIVAREDVSRMEINSRFGVQ